MTPELVIDLDHIANAYQAISSGLPGITVHYAMKCNPHPRVLTTLRDAGSRFEVASAPEVDTLVGIGVDPSEILYSNPVKPVAHIAHAYDAGVRMFAFDSIDEIGKLSAAAPGCAVIVRLACAGAVSDVPSEGKFGVSPSVATELLLAARSYGLVPYGIAFHVGSQMLDPAAWREPLVAVGRIMSALAPHGVTLRLVDLGGGFPARYSAPVPPLASYASVIRAGLAALPYPVDAVVEPGRAIAATAGTLTSTVIGTATRAGRRWVHLDVGAFNGLMESLETGNQLRFPVRDSRASSRHDLFHLTGPTCDSQDTIMFDVSLSADLRTGDQVMIGGTGAYTTVYASTFNGFAPPTVRCVSASASLAACGEKVLL